MIVCACRSVTLDAIIEAMQRHGNDGETIRSVTCAGQGCGECLDAAYEDVELPFPYALLNAEAILKQK